MRKAKLPCCRECCGNRRPSETGTLSFGDEREGDFNVFSFVVPVQTDETDWVRRAWLLHYPRWKLPADCNQLKGTGLSLLVVSRPTEVAPDAGLREELRQRRGVFWPWYSQWWTHSQRSFYAA